MDANSSSAVSTSASAVLDQKFLAFMMEIDKRYISLSKHERIRVEQWSKRLCQSTTNIAWKKSRNLHSMLLLDQVLNEKLEKPFIHLPPDSGLSMLQEPEVKARLSGKFLALQAEIQKISPGKRMQELEGTLLSKKDSPKVLNPSATMVQPKRNIVSAGYNATESAVSSFAISTKPTNSMLGRPKEDVKLPRSGFTKLSSPLQTKSSPQKDELIPELEKEELSQPEGKSLRDITMQIKSVEWKSNGNIQRLRSELEVLQTTLKHMKEEMKSKSEIISEQKKQIEKLTERCEKAEEENSNYTQELELIEKAEERRQKYQQEKMKDRETNEYEEITALNEETDAMLQKSKQILTQSINWEKRLEDKEREEKTQKDSLVQETKMKLGALSGLVANLNS